MDRAGILPPDIHIELIDGGFLEMAPIGPEHASSGTALAKRLADLLGNKALIRSQYPVQLDNLNLPQPDIAVVKPAPDFYRTVHPHAADVLLLVEIAQSSLKYDQSKKLDLYAAAEIPEVWIVNLVDRQLEIYRTPAHGRFSELRTLQPTATADLLAFPDIKIPLADIFG